MKRRLEKEKDAIALAISGIIKNYKIAEDVIEASHNGIVGWGKNQMSNLY